MTETRNPKTAARKRKWRSTWIAAGVFVALGAYVLINERGEVREPGQEPAVSELIGMKPDDVTRLELLHDGQSILLAKTGKEWRIEKPVQARADDGQVKSVLETLLTGKPDQTVADKVTDYKQYGLDKPAFQATFTDAKGHQKVLQTGLKDVRGFSVYARAADRPELFLLSSYSIDDLAKKKPGDLRDKTALTVDPNTVTRVTLAGTAGTVRVEKQGEKWQVTAPTPAPADTDEVKQVLNEVRDLKVISFEGEGAKGAASSAAAPDLARYGLAKPPLTVTMTSPTGDKGLLLGKPTKDGKNVYAMRQGEHEVFEVLKNTLDDLSKKPGDLRDKTLLSFKRDDATRVTITTPAQTLELARAGKTWSITKPTPGKPKDDRLSTLLFTLEVVKGSRVVEEKPADLTKYGFDKPAVRVQVELPKGAQELVIGKKSGKNDYYARSSSQTAVFTVPDFTMTDLSVKPADLAEGKK